MILCPPSKKRERIQEWVQTALNIGDSSDLNLQYAESCSEGIQIKCEVYEYNEWVSKKFTLYLSEIILFESFRKS
jgi:hypothetical protein